MDLIQLRKDVNSRAMMHPTLAGEFQELLQLAEDECKDDCASEESECNSCL